MTDDVEIRLINRQTPLAFNSVNYQPFGVKVLKLRVRRNPATQPQLGPVWIHPKGFLPPETASHDPGRWRVYGTADDPDLWVAWGAGDERGFAVKTTDVLGFNKQPAPLDDDDFHYVYLHLIHRPVDPFQHHPADKSLTVQATDQQGVVRGEATIDLTVPAGADNPIRAHWQTDWAAGISTIKLRGSGGQAAQLPRYISRWWPSGQVSYDPVDAAIQQVLDDLTVTFQRQDPGKDSGHLKITLGDDDLLVLTGDLSRPLHDYRLCHVELFRFLDDRHLVIRLWLYWLHLRFSADQLLTFVPLAEREDRRPEAEQLAGQVDAWLGAPQGQVRFLPWRIREEVPDVERFDLLIDPADLRDKFVGTDTHWQEFWAVVHKQGDPVEAEIAPLTSTAKVILQQRQLPKELKPPVFNPLANGLCDYVNLNSDSCPHRKGPGQMVPVDQLDPIVQYRVCEQCGTHFVGQGVKAVGLLKHAPVLGNVDVIQEATSSRVLGG